MSLNKLIKRLKKQDVKAQEKLYRIYCEKFFTLCLKYSSGYEQAEDNLQEGFIKIFSKIDQYDGRGSFEGWMTRIIINTSIKVTEKQPFFLTIDEETFDSPEIEIDEAEVSDEFLQKIIEELPEAYRHVFTLYAIEGLSHKEISEILKISIGTSKSNLSRARIKLKQRIENYYIHSAPAV